MGSKKWVNKVLTYLCQIANDNCHDDPINGNSFTKDNAKKKKKNELSPSANASQKSLGQANKPELQHRWNHKNCFFTYLTNVARAKRLLPQI